MFFFLRLLLHPVKEMLEMQEQGAKQERMLVPHLERKVLEDL